MNPKEDMNLYAILGVSSDATHSDIRKAYLKYVLISHPDKNKGEYANEDFIRVQEAYETLREPDTREKYDAVLSAKTTPSYAPAPHTSSAYYSNNKYSQNPSHDSSTRRESNQNNKNSGRTDSDFGSAAYFMRQTNHDHSSKTKPRTTDQDSKSKHQNASGQDRWTRSHWAEHRQQEKDSRTVEEELRRAAEEKARRRVAEAESRRRAAEERINEEANRRAAAEEFRNRVAEKEFRRRVAEAESRRAAVAAEVETRRRAVEEESRRRAAEVEARRRASIEMQQRQAQAAKVRYAQQQFTWEKQQQEEQLRCLVEERRRRDEVLRKQQKYAASAPDVYPRQQQQQYHTKKDRGSTSSSINHDGLTNTITRVYGYTKGNVPCKNCKKQNKYCWQHSNQDPKNRINNSLDSNLWSSSTTSKQMVKETKTEMRRRVARDMKMAVTSRKEATMKKNERKASYMRPSANIQDTTQKSAVKNKKESRVDMKARVKREYQDRQTVD